MQPFQAKAVGSGICTAIMYPDIFSNPFNIGIGVECISTVAASAVFAVEHCFDYRTVYSPSFNGNTALVDGAVQTAVWFQNSGLGVNTTGTTITTTTPLNGNYAFAVAAIRLNIYSAAAGQVVVANFLQSSNAP